MNVQEYIQSGVIESYVLDLATPEERAEVERYRLQYPEVEASILSMEAALEANCMENAVPLTQDVWDVIAGRLKQSNSLPDEQQRLKSLPANNPLRPVVNPNWRKLGVAAAVLLCVSLIGNVLLYQRYQNIHSDYTALVQEKDLLLAGLNKNRDSLDRMYAQVRTVAAPGMQKIPLGGVAGKETFSATVYWNSNSREVYLFPNNLPEAPPGRQYQLWALVDGKPVDAGVIDISEGLSLLKPILRADAFAITLEKEGGNNVPDLTQLYVMGKVSG